MRPSAKPYRTAYKKRVDVERDTYLPRWSPKGIMQCMGCGSFYYRRRWMLIPPAGEIFPPAAATRVFCPACKKIREGYPSGELHMSGVGESERREVFRILRNEEEQARQKNPLERIMRIEARNGGWWVETTTEKLAQRLGRSLRKARGGKLLYKWGHNNKFLRVSWERIPED
jgi:NMD protein affecting ribosome stability and mRNA decay